MKRPLVFFKSSLTNIFDLPENNQYTTICAAYWVTEGVERCIVGRVSQAFSDCFHGLEGRIAQVVEIYCNLRSAKKDAHSKKHNGVCIVELIDSHVDRDNLSYGCDSIIESNSDSD